VSDSDRESSARRVTPPAYLAIRPARLGGSGSSIYVMMPGGCRLAVDTYLPPEAPERLTIGANKPAGRRAVQAAAATTLSRRSQTPSSARAISRASRRVSGTSSGRACRIICVTAIASSA
jgi:hypothetical protein